MPPSAPEQPTRIPWRFTALVAAFCAVDVIDGVSPSVGPAALATSPNVSVEAPGRGQVGVTWSDAETAPVIRDVAAIFRPDRGMPGSDVPADAPRAPSSTTLDAFRAASEPSDEPLQGAIVHRDALRTCRPATPVTARAGETA